ncbi:MAG TPA: NAD(P)/FAD-dependent oxidoreductase, partial [Nitrospiraceae bacterium]|nr:NAD(P)/FAD-dependent oxidoreductase [Nitrospiraceae bacterium]
MSTHEDMHDIAVIGAGAAGLAASIFTAEAAAKGDRPQSIVLLDGVKTIGAKILVSGGGRCNVAHEVVTPTDYFGNRRIIRNVLAAFSVEQTVKWFASLGVELKREKTGKLFPVTDKARTILTALLNRCRGLGVIILSDHRVTRVDHLPGPQAAFSVHHTHGTLHARKVILA